MKGQVRRAALLARRSISPKQREDFGAIIANRLFESEAYKNAKRVMCYADYNGEVPTKQICARILADKKALFLPRCEGDGVMVCVGVTDMNSLKIGAYGILEPVGEKSFEEPDLVIVPVVAFDRKMGRMGYGGGYYDRFLAKTGAVRCAIAFGVQEAAKAAFEPTDVLMDLIITEREMITVE